MTVRVVVFGILKDVLSLPNGSERLDLASAATAGDVLSHMRARAAAAQAAVFDSVAIAVNGEFASATTRLSADDEVALLPPVSGG